MRNNVRIFLVITILALAALACQAVSGGGEAPAIPTVEVPDVEIPEIEIPTVEIPDILGGAILLRDDFSSAKWGTGTDADSAVEYVNNALNFDVFTEDYFVWSTPDGESYSDVRMEVTVINNGTDSTTAFGFICNKSAGNDFHYLVMTPAGQYAIAVAKEGEQDVFLTNNDEWADSDLIAVNADSYRVGAECGNGRLTLFVDGRQVASVADSTYTSGQVAVMVWSAEEAGTVNNVSFDDFLMTELE